MSPRFLFVLCLSAVAVVMVCAKDCPCSGGLNVCSCKPSAIRPQKVKKPNTCHRCEQPPYSYTDPCNKRRLTVSPAQKQGYRCACFPPEESSVPCQINPSATIPFSHDDRECGDTYYHEDKKQTEHLMGAVDPVSLYLARKNAKSPHHVDEAKLCYGFYKLPNEPVVEEAENVRESALNTISRKVLVLKDEPKKSKFAADSESCEDEDEHETPRMRTPTYNDLGYTTFNNRPCPDFSRGSSMFHYPTHETVQRYQVRSSNRRSGESTSHTCHIQY